MEQDKIRKYFKRKEFRSYDDLPKTKPLIEKFREVGRKRSLRYSPTSKIQLISVLDNFFSIIHKEYNKIIPDDLENYVSALRKKGIAEITIGNRLGIIQRFFNWLKEKGNVKENPVKISIDDSVENNIFLKKLREIPTIKEMKKMLEVTQHPRDNLILNLLFFLGMRVSELCNLKMSDLDSGRWSLTIDGKGDRVRAPPLPDNCITPMMNWLRYREGVTVKTDYLIVSRKGHRLEPEYVREIINNACGRAGVKRHLTPHSLRRWFITYREKLGKPSKETQYIVGQKTPNMIDRYAQFVRITSDFRNAWKDLDKLEEE